MTKSSLEERGIGYEVKPELICRSENKKDIRFIYRIHSLDDSGFSTRHQFKYSIPKLTEKRALLLAKEAFDYVSRVNRLPDDIPEPANALVREPTKDDEYPQMNQKQTEMRKARIAAEAAQKNITYNTTDMLNKGQESLDEQRPGVDTLIDSSMFEKTRSSIYQPPQYSLFLNQSSEPTNPCGKVFKLLNQGINSDMAYVVSQQVNNDIKAEKQKLMNSMDQGIGGVSATTSYGLDNGREQSVWAAVPPYTKSFIDWISVETNFHRFVLNYICCFIK
eukprot:GHVH01003331.1.p1 GENE.GHVH01003331.1~~GHVH01003331.1.p1  ORF type:complete len:277 (+),score=37.65 GHVH01003331.1:121-951(+)